MKRYLSVFATLLFLLMPATALAYNPLGGACTSGSTTSNSPACADNGTNNPIAGPNGVLKKASLIIATIAGVAAIIIIIIGGFQYITSNGDPQKASSARSSIIGAVVGLVIIASAEGIITCVISKT
jgi:hypothetical protein